MVDALKEAAAGRKAFFGDELVLLDFNAAAAAGELQPQALLLQDFFDPSVDSLPGLPVESGGGGVDEEEEELEWLANKDAFPSLETSFEIPAHSLSGGSSGWSGGGAAVSAREGPSPVSVLASAASFYAPARPRSKGRAQRRRLLKAISLQPVAAAAATARKARAAERRRCRHCLAEKTPQWRMGPEGPKTLCNACGVRYKSGRLVPEYRPASSPSFSAAIHSNSHRRILEIRHQKEAPRERKSTRPQPPPPLPLVTPPVKPIPKKTKKIKK